MVGVIKDIEMKKYTILDITHLRPPESNHKRFPPSLRMNLVGSDTHEHKTIQKAKCCNREEGTTQQSGIMSPATTPNYVENFSQDFSCSSLFKTLSSNHIGL